MTADEKGAKRCGDLTRAAHPGRPLVGGAFEAEVTPPPFDDDREKGATDTRSLKSRRFEHEQTGEPMPAYVVGEYVIEKNRRGWNHRVAGQSSVLWAGPKEWWEVRRQGARTQPGVSIGPLLYSATTLRECRQWIEAHRAA